MVRLRVHRRRALNLGDHWETIEIGEEWDVPDIFNDKQRKVERRIKAEQLDKELVELFG